MNFLSTMICGSVLAFYFSLKLYYDVTLIHIYIYIYTHIPVKRVFGSLSHVTQNDAHIRQCLKNQSLPPLGTRPPVYLSQQRVGSHPERFQALAPVTVSAFLEAVTVWDVEVGLGTASSLVAGDVLMLLLFICMDYL